MSRLLSSLEYKLNLQLLSPKLVGCPIVHQFVRKPPIHQCVRCYRPRKPFWLPTAKSKLFRIPTKPEIPNEEREEIARLYNVYRTNMKSLQQYFKEQLMVQTTAPEVIEQRKQKEANQHAECVKLNDAWNKEVEKLRESRLANEAIKREEQILKKIMEDEEKQRESIAKIEALILEEKAASKTFITQNNIDEAIEAALSNIVDHNFCIDLEGKVYQGRYTKPVDQKRKILTPKAINVPEETTPLEARG